MSLPLFTPGAAGVKLCRLCRCETGGGPGQAREATVEAGFG